MLFDRCFQGQCRSQIPVPWNVVPIKACCRMSLDVRRPITIMKKKNVQTSRTPTPPSASVLATFDAARPRTRRDVNSQVSRRARSVLGFCTSGHTQCVLSSEPIRVEGVDVPNDSLRTSMSQNSSVQFESALCSLDIGKRPRSAHETVVLAKQTHEEKFQPKETHALQSRLKTIEIQSFQYGPFY